MPAVPRHLRRRLPHTADSVTPAMRRRPSSLPPMFAQGSTVSPRCPVVMSHARLQVVASCLAHRRLTGRPPRLTLLLPTRKTKQCSAQR